MMTEPTQEPTSDLSQRPPARRVTETSNLSVSLGYTEPFALLPHLAELRWVPEHQWQVTFYFGEGAQIWHTDIDLLRQDTPRIPKSDIQIRRSGGLPTSAPYTVLSLKNKAGTAWIRLNDNAVAKFLSRVDFEKENYRVPDPLTDDRIQEWLRGPAATEF